MNDAPPESLQLTLINYQKSKYRHSRVRTSPHEFWWDTILFITVGKTNRIRETVLKHSNRELKNRVPVNFKIQGNINEENQGDINEENLGTEATVYQR